MKNKKRFIKRIKKFYKKLDELVNIKEQLIGWTAIILTALICWGIIKFILSHPEWVAGAV